MKDPDLSDDITQEAFVEILTTLCNLKEPVAFVTWAKQITYHQCTRHFKKKKDILVDEDGDGKTVFDDMIEDTAEFIPDEALEKDEFRRTVLSILDTLSEEQRSAIMMYYFDELPISKIAEIQGVSEGTVKSRLNYARKAIKAAVEDYEKKNNVKLHALPFFPLMRFLFSGDSADSKITPPAFENIAQSIFPKVSPQVKSASSNIAKGVANGAKTTANAAAKAPALKIIAAVAAAAVGVCAVAGTAAVIGGAIAISNIFKRGDAPPKEDTTLESTVPEKDVAGTTDSETASETDGTVEYDKIFSIEDLKLSNAGALSSFGNIKGKILAEAASGKLLEKTEDPNSGNDLFRYEISSPQYNIFNYKASYTEDSYSFTRVDGFGFDKKGICIKYKIPVEKPEDSIELMKADLAIANSIMKEVYDGNLISPDFEPSFSDLEYDFASHGAYKLCFNINQSVPYDIGARNTNEISFVFICIEEDGKYFYCPSVTMHLSDTEGTEWNATAISHWYLMV